MNRVWIWAMFLLVTVPSAAFADSGKDESGKGRKTFKEFRKQQEKRGEQQEKFLEKRHERAEKLREKERKEWEKEQEWQENARGRYWDDVEERREWEEERSEEWRERHRESHRPRSYRPRRSFSEWDDRYEDFGPRAYPQYRHSPQYGSEYEDPYRGDFRYDDRYRSSNIPPRHAAPQSYGDDVEGIYTPFGYYEEYRRSPGWNPDWDRRASPRARARIGPLQFEVWE